MLRSRPYPPCPADAFVSETRSALRSSGLAGLVSVGLERQGYDEVEVTGIRSEVERGAGHASRAMGILARVADGLAVSLLVVPCAFPFETDFETPEEASRMALLDARALRDEDLVAWYGRLGFAGPRDCAGFPVMRRPPVASGSQAGEEAFVLLQGAVALQDVREAP